MISAFRQIFRDTGPEAISRKPLAMIGVSLAVFALSLILGTWNNSFPYYYHLDEPLEVWMVIHGTTNFHHPLLMGNTTDLVTWLLGVGNEPQTVVELGRWCIAIFGAVASVAFAWVGYRYAGLAGGLASGVFVAMHPLLVEVAHYYKEDPALLMGVGLSFLAVTRFWDNPSRGNAAALGVANALAFSGKYIGIVMAALSIAVLILARPRPGRVICCFLYTALFVVAVGIINYQLVAGAGQGFHGIGREVALLGTGGKHAFLNEKYVGVFYKNSNFLILIFAGWYVLRLVLQPKERVFPEYLIAAFPLAFALMISLTPKTAERYFLPVSATVCLLAGIGLADLCRHFFLLRTWLPRRRRILYSALLAGTCVLFASPVVDCLMGFGIDTRKQLAHWIEKNVPPDAVIVQDRRVQLVAVSGKSMEQRSFSVPQQVLSNQYAADFGSVSELQSQGILYIALMVGQKYRNHPSARVKSREEFDNFVREVTETGTLLWKSESRTPQIVNPRLELYRLPEPDRID